MTPFNPKPYEIISKKGSMITAEIEDHSIMRDSSFFKHLKVPHKLTNSSDWFSKNSEESVENISKIFEEDTPDLRRSNRDGRPPSYLKDYVC